MGPGMRLLLVALAVVILMLCAYALRMRILMRKIGSIQIALRKPGQKWVNWIAVLSAHSLDLYSTISLRPGPNLRWARPLLSIQLLQMVGDVQVVELGYRKEKWELASEPDEISALVAWMDSSAPEGDRVTDL